MHRSLFNYGLLLFFFILLFSQLFSQAQAEELSTDTQAYVIEKCKENDIVFLGTRHQQPLILNFISGLIPKISDIGGFYICLEIASDQQDKIDNSINLDDAINRIEIAPQIDCPGYRRMLKTICKQPPDKFIKPVAIDLPRSRFKEDISRDEYMAQVIAKRYKKNPTKKILVILGNLHILKKLDWEDQVSAKHKSIREYLTDLCPGVSMFSIAQIIGNDPEECDFTKAFGHIDETVALDCTERFSGWNLGILQVIAIKTAEPYKLFGGVIVY